MKKIFFLFATLSLAIFSTCQVQAGTNERIIFLHHSTGGLVYNYPAQGVPSWISNYNSSHGTSYSITQRGYPTTPYPWNNYPYDYWNLWVNGACNSSDPDIECMNTLTQNYDVIIYKHCFPGASVLADQASSSESSSVKTLGNYKLQYRELREMMDGYPNNKFIVWTLAPLREADTNAANAARAKQFVDWVKNEWLTEDGQSHSNIYVFDYWGLTADPDNFLKDSYVSGDSHPNSTANNITGPAFAQFIVNTASSSAPSDSTPPSVPSGLSVS